MLLRERCQLLTSPTSTHLLLLLLRVSCKALLLLLLLLLLLRISGELLAAAVPTPQSAMPASDQSHLSSSAAVAAGCFGLPSPRLVTGTAPTLLTALNTARAASPPTRSETAAAAAAAAA
jgi:hypothetical protein